MYSTRMVPLQGVVKVRRPAALEIVDGVPVDVLLQDGPLHSVVEVLRPAVPEIVDGVPVDVLYQDGACRWRSR